MTMTKLESEEDMPEKKYFIIPRIRLFSAIALVIVLLILIGVSCFYGGKHSVDHHKHSEGANNCSKTTSDKSTKPGPATPNSPKPEELRLPRHLSPIKYTLNLSINIPSEKSDFPPEKNFTFEGKMKLQFRCLEATDRIVLNAHETLNISSETMMLQKVNTAKPLGLKNMVMNATLEKVEFRVDSKLEAGAEYVLSIDYVGEIGEKLGGIYRSHYLTPAGQTIWLAATQFEPVNARRAFPGFDEPDFKAEFNVNIRHPSDRIAISNGEIISTTNDGSNWKVTTFETTPKMSTYLVALSVCDFEYTEKKTKRGTQFRIYARKEFKNQTALAAEVGPKILDYYEDFFKIPFPLKKIDMIAFPDFEAGAMENWGLITYREANLLYDEKIYTLKNKQRVIVVIAHELAHMWFGNLVTMKWWDDIWLNEGFASYMEYLGTDIGSDGKFRMKEQFLPEALENALSRDQESTSHPLVIPILKATDVDEIFDTISYDKGASVIRMMSHVIGDDVFNTGLTAYLKQHSYANADHNNLWDSLSEASRNSSPKNLDWNGRKLNVSELAAPWTLQMGYPVVTVSRKDNEASISQDYFKINPNATENPIYKDPPFNQKWFVPIWYKRGSGKTGFDWLSMDQNNSFSGLKANEWIILNPEAWGFYRVNYDDEGWKLIAEQLKKDHKVFAMTTRTQLIDDVFQLARSGRTKYTVALTLTEYLGKETEFLPWDITMASLNQFVTLFQSSAGSGFEALKNYLLSIVQPQYADSLWTDPVPTDDVLAENKKDLIIRHACYLGHKPCINVAKTKFNELVAACNGSKLSSGCNTLQAVERGSVYCYGIKHGNEADWEFLWDRFTEEQVQVETLRIIKGLSCTQSSWLIKKMLNKCLDGTIRSQDVPYFFLYSSFNLVGSDLMWGYFVKNWDKIYSKFGETKSLLKSIVRSATDDFRTPSQLELLENFMRKYPKETDLNMFQEQVANAKANVAWMEKYYEDLSKWFIQHTSHTKN